jgi:hypothetical protein
MMQYPFKNDHFGFHFGERDFQNRIHPGDDYNGPGAGAADKGTPMVAIADAEITYVNNGRNGGFGNMLYYKIDMRAFFKKLGVDFPEWSTDFVWVQYAHCDDIQVTEGQKVKKGDVIAKLGGSPNWSPHLHWEVRKRALGVRFYPSKSMTLEQVEDRYFNPTKFVAAVNDHITQHMTNPGFTPESDLIKEVGKNEIYFYNGDRRFLIPNWDTFLDVFGHDAMERVEEVAAKHMKNIPEDKAFTSTR